MKSKYYAHILWVIYSTRIHLNTNTPKLTYCTPSSCIFPVPSSLSSASPSPVHQVASSPSFSPIHQPVTTNMRKWVDADRSDTEAEESLISQNLSGMMMNYANKYIY